METETETVVSGAARQARVNFPIRPEERFANMVYDSTKTLLRSIVLSLESGQDAAWDDQIESGKECLYEMHQMTRAFCRVDKNPNSKTTSHNHHVERLTRAMPHVKNMVSALRRNDQATALESGKAALAAM